MLALTEGQRLGFEDIAALAGLRARDVLADRKIPGQLSAHGGIAAALQLHSDDLHRFFAQVAFSIMVRNGDAHLNGWIARCAASFIAAKMRDAWAQGLGDAR